MKRPLPVTLISCLFMASGTVGIVYHTSDLWEISAPEVGWVLFVRVLAVVGGVFALRGANWARWLLLGWISYHVILSFFHSTTELIVHAVLLVVVALALFHPKANAYYKSKV